MAADAKKKLRPSDIVEILKSESDDGTIVVKTKSGLKYRLKVNEEQKEEIQASIQRRNKVRKAKLAKKKTEITKEAAAQTTTATLPLSQGGGVPTVVAKAEEPLVENKSPWGFSHLVWVSSNVNKLHTGEGSTNFYNRFTAQYNTKNNYALKFRPTFTFDWDHQKSAATNQNLSDWVLEVQKKGLKLPFDISVSPYLRYYLPTSQGTIDGERAGMLHLSGMLNKQINPMINVYYWPTARYYLNSKASNATFDEFDRVNNDPSGNVGFRYIHSIGVGEKINDTFSLGQSIGLDHKFKYSDPEIGVDGTNTTNFSWDFSVSLSLIDWMGLTLSVDQNHQLGGEEGFSFFKTSEMTYNIITNFTFQ